MKRWWPTYKFNVCLPNHLQHELETERKEKCRQESHVSKKTSTSRPCWFWFFRARRFTCPPQLYLKRNPRSRTGLRSMHLLSHKSMCNNVLLILTTLIWDHCSGNVCTTLPVITPISANKAWRPKLRHKSSICWSPTATSSTVQHLSGKSKTTHGQQYQFSLIWHKSFQVSPLNFASFGPTKILQRLFVTCQRIE